MKKVRLFAVAAAMGMFASTVAAAEPVVSTGYTTTWEGVEEIIKVDVGNKVVAPVTTIKVVKETRTTDTEYNVTDDVLGFDTTADCWTGTTVSEDKNVDDYSDVQIYVNGLEGGYYTSEYAAVKDYLNDRHMIIAPGAAEVEGNTAYYAKYANKFFADYEEAFAWLEEQGLYESVYDEEGDLKEILVKPTVITNKNGKKLADAHFAFPVTARNEDDVKEALVKEAVEGNLLSDASAGLEFERRLLTTYSEDDEKVTKAKYAFKANVKGQTGLKTIELGGIVVVEESKGEMVVVDYFNPEVGQTVATASNEYIASWGSDGLTPVAPQGTEGKITVYEVVSRKGEVVKASTIKPTTVKAYTSKASMIWDEEAGSFVKTTNDYDVIGGGDTGINGFWLGKEYNETTDTTNGLGYDFLTSAMDLSAYTLGLDTVDAQYENSTSKWVLDLAYSGLNLKKEQVSFQYTDANGNEKEVAAAAVELDKRVWRAAFDSEEELVNFYAKLTLNVGHKFTSAEDDGLAAAGQPTTDFDTWYNATEELVNNPWSGYTQEGDTPENEKMGNGAEACSYVVSVESEEVTATVEATEVDTKEAGVKTMTLKAIVDGETVATKDVKVVVAPRYERTYVNGKVAVLKSFYLDGTLYSEYHYDWAAKTYTATFYANDGVTVASTANGTL